MEENYKNIDEYIRLFPEDIQEILNRIRDIVRQAAPMAEEAIAYGMPTFRMKGKNLVHFAAFKDHVGVFPTGADLGELEKKLVPFRTGKGTISFSLDVPIPFELIGEIVQARVTQQRK